MGFEGRPLVRSSKLKSFSSYCLLTTVFLPSPLAHKPRNLDIQTIFIKNVCMKKIDHFMITGIVLALVLAAGNLGGEVKMKKEEQHKAVARLVEEMYNRDLNKADEIFHPDCLHHINGSDEKLLGPDAIRQSILQMKESFVSFHTTINELFGENDQVAFRWTWVGKMKGSGLDYTLHGNTIFRFADGKVIEEWAVDDRLREMLKLGFTLTPPGRGEKVSEAPK